MNNSLPSAARAAMQFQEKILPNGLALRLMPMPEYNSAHVIYASSFGAINRGYVHNGKSIWLPAGVAHFLEHKMFENEDGTDASALFAETGAMSNAYTGFDRTSYIFTATNRIEQNLAILLSFVGHPYFTQQTVQKEQGIIGQEIKMYEDEPDLRCYFAMLAGLYHNHPVREDIVGTVQSIAEITPEMLYDCCNAFYVPSNMALCAAGNITMQQLEEAVYKAGLPQAKQAPVQRLFAPEPPSVASAGTQFEMAVAMPQFAIGFKETPPANQTAKMEVVCDMMVELLCGETSPLYHRLYDEGLVQAGFAGEAGGFTGCQYFGFTGESPQPEKVRELLLKEIARQRQNGIDASQFATCKNMMYGDAVSGLESVERRAGLLSATYFKGRTPEDELAAIAALTEADINEALNSMLCEDASTMAVVLPCKE